MKEWKNGTVVAVFTIIYFFLFVIVAWMSAQYAPVNAETWSQVEDISIWIIIIRIFSSLLMGFCYITIPSIFIWVKHKKGIGEYRWWFVVFLAFFYVGGISRLTEVVTIWYPIYWITQYIKLLTGMLAFFVTFGIFKLRHVLVASNDPVKLLMQKPETLKQDIEAIEHQIAAKQIELVSLTNVLHEIQEEISGRDGTTDE